MANERLKIISRHLTYRSRPVCMKTNNIQNDEEFVFTLNKNGVLTRDQRAFYEENGYLVVRKLVNQALLGEFKNHFVDLCQDRCPKGSISLVKDISLMKRGATGEYLYNKAQDILWDEIFEKYPFCPEVLNIIEGIVGPNIKVVHSMLINKPPDPMTLTSRHPLHQDLHYFPFRPANRIACSWTAIERTTTDNGCLVLIPGSHRWPLLHHDYPRWENGVNKVYHGITSPVNDASLVPLHMEPGDTVFFHPLLVHGSGANITKGFRKAITFHFAASECYYIDVMGTTQENIAVEVLEIAARKGAKNIDYRDVWRLRSRLVRGAEATL